MSKGTNVLGNQCPRFTFGGLGEVPLKLPSGIFPKSEEEKRADSWPLLLGVKHLWIETVLKQNIKFWVLPRLKWTFGPVCEWFLGFCLINKQVGADRVRSCLSQVLLLFSPDNNIAQISPPKKSSEPNTLLLFFCNETKSDGNLFRSGLLFLSNFARSQRKSLGQRHSLRGRRETMLRKINYFCFLCIQSTIQCSTYKPTMSAIPRWAILSFTF